QHVARAVRVHRLSDLRGRAELLAGRRVVRLRLVREARGIEDVYVTINLRLLEDSHIHDGTLESGGDRLPQCGSDFGHDAEPRIKRGARLIEQQAEAVHGDVS